MRNRYLLMSMLALGFSAVLAASACAAEGEPAEHGVSIKPEVLVQLGHRTYKTLSPVTLLKAKLANFVDFPQNSPGQERNDLKHIRILVPCVAAYLDQGLDRVRAGVFTERSFVNLLEATLTIGKSDHARRTSQSAGLDFMRCFPASLRTTDLSRVKNFVHYRLTGT